MSSTYSNIEFVSHCCLLRRQRSPSLLYKCWFSHSNSLLMECWVCFNWMTIEKKKMQFIEYKAINSECIRKKRSNKWPKWHLKVTWLTRLLRHITGQNEHPSVQQQQMQPHRSHLMLFYEYNSMQRDNFISELWTQVEISTTNPKYDK